MDITSIPGIGRKLTIGRDTDVSTQGFNFKAGAASDKIIDVQSLTSGAQSTGIVYNVSRGSLGTKTVVQAGDVLTSIKVQAHDGTNEDTLSSMIQWSVEPGSTISTGNVPGKLYLISTPDGGSTWAGITVDSAGRLCVGGTGVADSTSALDVTGNARVSGYHKVGNLTTVERDALTAESGMIIYNTTDSKFQGRTGAAWVDLH